MKAAAVAIPIGLALTVGTVVAIAGGKKKTLKAGESYRWRVVLDGYALNQASAAAVGTQIAANGGTDIHVETENDKTTATWVQKQDADREVKIGATFSVAVGRTGTLKSVTKVS